MIPIKHIKKGQMSLLRDSISIDEQLIKGYGYVSEAVAVVLQMKRNIYNGMLNNVPEFEEIDAIQQLQKYTATVKYHRTDDLQKGSPINGSKLNLKPLWIQEEGDSFAGQWVFKVLDSNLEEDENYPLWIPQCDLVDIKLIK